MNRRAPTVGAAALVLVLAIVLIRGSGPGDPVRVVIPTGATLSAVSDSLASAGVIGNATGFSIYARLRRADRKLKAGTYDLETGTSWYSALRIVTRGEVVTVPVTIPEGYTVAQMAGPLAELAGVSEQDALATLRDPALVDELGTPGPGLDGYLFPDTYRFARGVPVAFMARAMAARYAEVWTPQRRALLEERGLTENEAVTLASIIQAEARQVHEMPRISGVYSNRLRDGWRLQADPTVLYALGGYRERLLYAAIDSVQNHPYNTYGRAGLPPGPIGAPGELAIDAALAPEPHDFMYFVAWPDGSHIFTRSLGEHNVAKEDAARARDSARTAS